MRFKYLKYLASALGGISTAVAAGALYLYATFDGARLAGELAAFSRQHYQRTLRFDGPLALSMFPRLALVLPPLSLSGRGGEGESLGLEGGRLGLRLMPLLAREVVVSRVELDGLRLALRRGKDGRLNVADLLEALPDDAPVALDAERLSLARGAINGIDEVSGRSFALSELALTSDRLGRKADGRLELAARLTQAAPQASDARVELSAGYRIDPAASELRNLHLTARGQLADRPSADLDLTFTELQLPADGAAQLAGFAFTGKDRQDGRSLELRVAAPKVQLAEAGVEAATAEASLRLDAKGEGGVLRARLGGIAGRGGQVVVDSLNADLDWKGAAGRLAGTLAGRASWQPETRVAELPQLAGELSLTRARPGATPLRIAAQLGGRVDVGRDSAAGRLDLRFDDTRLQGSWSLPRLSAGSVGFDLDADRFDADRYLGPFDAATSLDTRVLVGLEADGVLRLASLTLGGAQLERVRLPVAVHEGKLAATAFNAALYGGTLDGSLSLAADGKAALRAYLQNAAVAPLLRASLGREPVQGLLNFFIEASASGRTVGELRDALAGQARLRLRNGVVRGIDAAAVLKDWRAAIQARQAARRPYRESESTAVGELTAGFQIAGGRARTADLQARTPALALAGNGEVNLGEARIDLLTRLTLLAVAPPDLPQLAALRGVAVPLRARGALAQPEWQYDPTAQPTVPAPVVPPPRPQPKPKAAPPRPVAPKPAVATPAPEAAAE